MPELPDITVYVEALQERLVGRPLHRIRIASPFVLRSVRPRPSEVEGRTVTSVRRLGKRIVIGLEGEVFIVLHLMIAGRLHFRAPGAKTGGRTTLAAFDIPEGSLVLTEASSRKRASMHLVEGEAAVASFHAGGVEPLECDPPAFAAALRRENHTLKRALTDPSIVSGVGNAYSDEILHRARLSPVLLTSRMDDEAAQRLFDATRAVLEEWTRRLREEAKDRFPEKVTAFREGMSVHGRYDQPCPVCGTPVQRIVYSENEANYCPTCQTGGRLLADRSLSRLMRGDWPKTLEELEGRIRSGTDKTP